jgi:hypothetical protein
MSKLVDAAIEFSNGRWVSADAMLKHLKITNAKQNPIFRMQQLGSKVALQTQSDSNGIIIRYKAFAIRDKGCIELAKMRKALGILGSVESVQFGGKGL